MRQPDKERRHPPRLVVVTQLFHPENFRVNDMVTEWARRGYRVTVVTGIPNYPAGRFYDGYGYTRRRREMWNGVRVIRLPILKTAREEVGRLQTANVVAVGCINELLKIVSRESIEEAVEMHVPKGTEALNKKALEAGEKLMAGYLAGGKKKTKKDPAEEAEDHPLPGVTAKPGKVLA